jgi:hypothetical protein
MVLGDDAEFRPYNEEINQLIERKYLAMKEAGAEGVFLTPEIRRFSNDRLAIYEINFIKGQQMNFNTKYRRSIERRAVIINSTNVEWSYQLENSSWRAYDSMLQAEFESKFRDFAHQGRSVFPFRVPGQSEHYELDFSNGKQRNLNSNTERNIRREVK